MRTRLVHHTGRALLVAAVGVGLITTAASVSAAEATVGLGTAGSYAILAGSTITNTGPSVIQGDVGLHPGSAVVGFPPATVTNGSIHVADAAAAQAQSDTTIAFNDAAGRSPTGTVLDLGGQLLIPGVYTATTSLALTGTVTLDAQGDPAAVFVFQAGTTLTTAGASTVALVNGASPCNVFWQIGSSATLGTNSVFVGTVLALESITATTGATIEGRLLARNAAVTLDTNTITAPLCTAPSSTPTDVATDATSTPTSDGGAAPIPAGGSATTAGSVTPAPAGDSSTATGRTTSSGDSTTATTRSGNPPLATTGVNLTLATIAGTLLLLGSALTWIGRRPLLRAGTAPAVLGRIRSHR